jgi:penicillin-binding protein 1B
MAIEEQVPHPEIPSESQGSPEPHKTERPPFFERRSGRILLFSSVGIFAVFLVVFGSVYLRYARIIDQRLAAGPFSDSVNIYTAPRTVSLGDPITPQEVVARLRRGGYTTAPGNNIGWYNVRPDAVEVFPGRDSDTGGEPGVLHFANGKVSRIVSLQDNTERKELLLEPQLIANFTPQERGKRRLVRYSDLPPSLVEAVVSAEDKHFFHHSGFDLFRVAKAAYIDMREHRKEQGGSTLTMQLARSIWLGPTKNFRRKFHEVLITMHLEFKLNKQQIFEDYANQIYLGQNGTFSIHGFGEAARVYFDKEVSQLTMPEAALLAGMIQRPSYFNPYRYPRRARERRDLVLRLMQENGYLTPQQYEAAARTPVKVTPPRAQSTEMQYFVDLVNEELQHKLADSPQPIHYIYTTLDPDLQDAAQAAVDYGMALVDRSLGKGRRGGSDQPQVALIALDPHTGEIKAVVGGRNYGHSQLNHVLAMRPPGSVFKPIVYAAALDTEVDGGPKIFTPASTIDDSPTTFTFGGRTYQPANFKDQYFGTVTLRTALAHSLNNAAVGVAQEVGFQRVVDMAHRLGLNEAIKPTPAVALGAYETTPLEIARAYTVFANGGERMNPTTISVVRDDTGRVLYRPAGNPHRALDPRVNYLMVSMLQDVLEYGTGASVRGRGFNLPAAGKTGTSHDGWFAGFTSSLLCVVWVGFDDYRDLNLEGAHSALPIWTEFMKRAVRFRRYADARPFDPPPGIVMVKTCADSGELGSPDCTRAEPFLQGTQPVVACCRQAEQRQSADRAEVAADSPSTPPPAAPRRSTIAAAPPEAKAAPPDPLPPAPLPPARTPPPLPDIITRPLVPNMPPPLPSQPTGKQ